MKTKSKQLSPIQEENKFRYLATIYGLHRGEVQLSIKGPRPNVDCESIRKIEDLHTGERLLLSAKSHARQKAIALKILSLVPTNLPVALNWYWRRMEDAGCLGLLKSDIALGVLWREKWEEVFRNMKKTHNDFGSMKELFLQCPIGTLRDCIFLLLLREHTDSFAKAVQLMELFVSSCNGVRFSKKDENCFWLAAEQAADFTQNETENDLLIRKLISLCVYDPVQPACQMAMRKAFERKWPKI